MLTESYMLTEPYMLSESMLSESYMLSESDDIYASCRIQRTVNSVESIYTY